MIKGMEYEFVTYCDSCGRNGNPNANFCWHCGGRPRRVEVMTEKSFSKLFRDIISALGDGCPHEASTNQVLEAIGCDSVGLLRNTNLITEGWYSGNDYPGKDALLATVKGIAKSCHDLSSLLNDALDSMAAYNHLVDDSCDWAAEAVAEDIEKIGSRLYRLVREEWGDKQFEWSYWSVRWVHWIKDWVPQEDLFAGRWTT